MFFLFLISTFSFAQLPIIERLEDPNSQLGERFQVILNPMVEDSLNNIWIATKKGLCKYTGSSIQSFTHVPGDSSTISTDDIENMFLDSRQRIWLAVKSQGINVFDLMGKKIYDFSFDPENPNGLKDNNIWGIFEDDNNNIWLSYFSGGISRFDPNTERFEYFDLGWRAEENKLRVPTVINVRPAKEPNTFWLGTTTGLFKFNAENQEYELYNFYHDVSDLPFEKTNIKYDSLSCNWARSMMIDQEGIIWLGTFGGLVRFDPETKKHRIFYEGYEALIRHNIGLEQYDADHILLSIAEGIALFNTKSFQLTILKDQVQADPDFKVFGRIYRARNGCLYIMSISANSPGIYRMCDQFMLADQWHVGNYVLQVMATENYVHYYDQKIEGIQSKHLKSGETRNFPLPKQRGKAVRSYHELGGDSLLVTDYYDTFYFHPDQGLTRIKELSQTDPLRNESILQDSKGNIWSGRYRNGLLLFDKINNSITHLNHQSDPAIVYQDNIADLLEDKNGNIWIATEQGWSVYNYDSQAIKNYHSREIARQEKINIQSISSFAQNEVGKMWIGDLRHGILLWDSTADTLIQHFNIQNGMRNQAVYDLTIADHDNLWAITEGGLSCINTKTLSVKNFGKEIGLFERCYNINKGENGQYYIGNAKGYYSFDPAQLLSFESPVPLPKVTGFNIFSQNSDSLLLYKNPIRLSYNQNFFSFNFGSINYYNPLLEKYQVRLHNLDEQWIDVGNKRFKSYTNLSPGEYAFQVRVTTDNGHWVHSQLLPIEVLPVWWQASWFRILALLTIATLIYFVLKRKEKRIQEKAHFEKQLIDLKTKALRAQMNPHFLFNSLNSIRYQIVSNNNDRAAAYLTKFSRLVRMILQNSEKDLVALNDELNLLDIYVQMERVRFRGAFEYLVNIDEQLLPEQVMIPPMIIQPFVENAIIHGINPKKGVGKIEINIEGIGDKVKITLGDDGIGRQASAQLNSSKLENKKSMGMQITNERIKLLMEGNNIQNIVIRDLYDGARASGTEVSFELPYIINQPSA